MGIRTKLIAALLATATLTATAGTATSATPTSPAASTPSGEQKEGTDKDDVLAKVAASLHVSVRQLVTALDHLKQATGKGMPNADAVAAFAKELKISVAQAKKALRELSKAKPKPGKDKPIVSEDVVKLLAAELAALDKVKQEVGGKPKEKNPSGSPAK